MTLHRINLRKPWRCEPCEGGRCWRRRFGRPTGLGPAETVWLAFAAVGEAGGVVDLNGQPLGQLCRADIPQRFEVTGKLAARNEVSITLRGEAGPSKALSATVRAAPPGNVFLEIDAAKAIS